VSPLDWGLGHASRMIPIIRQLICDGNQVMLAGSGRSGALLKATFTGLPFHDLPSLSVRLGNFCPFFHLMLQLPLMVISVFREHHLTRRLLKKYPVDVIISDNRYGVYSQKALSVLVTHQVSPVLPPVFRWFEYPLYCILKYLILRFDACWIPDLADPEINLSGKLSHRYPLPRNTMYIGPLSRFAGMQVPPLKDAPRLAVVISGPEPQGSRFESLIRKQLIHHPMSTVIAGGFRKVPRGTMPLPPGVSRTEHPDDAAMAALLVNAGLVVCRSGYSSIMDLAALGVCALLVPTPGQTEQKYLAKWISEKGWCTAATEKSLDLTTPALADLYGDLPGITDLGFLNELYRKYEEHCQQSEQES